MKQEGGVPALGATTCVESESVPGWQQEETKTWPLSCPT
jgi:hypothetical protein